MIDVQNLQKSFGTLKAVDGVTFQIHKGETFGLLGPNGAGKSTTIHMIVGALKPDGGQVTFEGGIAGGSKQAQLGLGVAPQALALYEELTAEENLAFFGTVYALDAKRLQERVEACLEFAGLQDRRRDRVRTYSGGMKRRLNIAVALIHEPRVVLFDEPTAGVDPQSRNHIFEGIEQLRAEGKTVLYTTHYMEEAERLCDRVAIMDHGKILAVDTVEGLIRDHGGPSQIVAEFTESPVCLNGLSAELDGLTLRLSTTKAAEDLSRIAQLNAPLASLNLERSNLEKVFLKLTGRSLRD